MQPTEQEPTHAPFRIDDELYLDYQPLTTDELAQAPAWRHDTSGFCDGLIRLREISLQSGHILASIRKHHPDIGHYLALLDRKIEILAQLTATVGLGTEIAPTHRVKLGAEGMCFSSDEAMPIDTPLHLKLVLFPSHLCLQLESRVSACTVKDEGYQMEVVFQSQCLHGERRGISDGSGI